MLLTFVHTDSPYQGQGPCVVWRSMSNPMASSSLLPISPPVHEAIWARITVPFRSLEQHMHVYIQREDPTRSIRKELEQQIYSSFGVSQMLAPTGGPRKSKILFRLPGDFLFLTSGASVRPSPLILGILAVHAPAPPPPRGRRRIATPPPPSYRPSSPPRPPRLAPSRTRSSTSRTN
jgi:hypothetical protein